MPLAFHVIGQTALPPFSSPAIRPCPCFLVLVVRQGHMKLTVEQRSILALFMKLCFSLQCVEVRTQYAPPPHFEAGNAKEHVLEVMAEWCPVAGWRNSGNEAALCYISVKGKHNFQRLNTLPAVSWLLMCLGTCFLLYRSRHH